MDEFYKRTEEILRKYPDLAAKYDVDEAFTTIVAKEFKTKAPGYLESYGVTGHMKLARILSKNDSKGWLKLEHIASKDFMRSTFLMQYGKKLCLESDWFQEFISKRE